MGESASGPVSTGYSEEFLGTGRSALQVHRNPLKDNLLIAILIVIGISEPLAFLADWPFIRAIGRLSSTSNCPLVFNQVGGIEFWASHFEFELIDRNGTVSTLPVTRELLSRIRGPHTRTAAYVVPIGLGPVAGPAFYRAPLLYALCDHGPLARDLGYLGDLESASIHIQSGSPNDHRQWLLTLECRS